MSVVTKRFTGDYKTKFNDAVTELVAAKIPDRTERMTAIDALINEYIRDTDEVPESRQLERLTNAILMEELTDMHPDKVTRDEYPFLSEWQFDRRHESEYSLKLAENIDNSGRDHKAGKRRFRTSKENALVDKYAKSRNEERRRQYRKDTELVTYETYKLNRDTIEWYLAEKYGAHRLRYSR